MPDRLASVSSLLVLNGVDVLFIAQPSFGIPDEWGRAVYAFDDDVSALAVVLAAVDYFITLCDGPMPSPWMVFDPMPRFTEPMDWETGMPHRPRERAALEAYPGLPGLGQAHAEVSFLGQASYPGPKPYCEELARLAPGGHLLRHATVQVRPAQVG